jgi:hypothetical protein
VFLLRRNAAYLLLGAMTKGSSKFNDPERAVSPDEARRVLGILCTKYGFCLPPLWDARLTKNPPNSVAKFTDTVIRAEGLNPSAVETSLYQAMYAEVQQAFERSTRSEGDQ